MQLPPLTPKEVKLLKSGPLHDAGAFLLERAAKLRMQMHLENSTRFLEPIDDKNSKGHTIAVIEETLAQVDWPEARLLALLSAVLIASGIIFTNFVVSWNHPLKQDMRNTKDDEHS